MAERPVSREKAARFGSPYAALREERPPLRGKLKIFFSYAPGTGKTLAMLEDGYRRQQEGVDVVVGYIEPHGELLALQLLEKMEVLSQRVVLGSGLSLHGMDLDQILARKPQLVLIDHLARANPPGLRHVSRYLDIDEILDAGIDVYTTLNIYQLESQVDAVEYIAGIVVRETVPDRFLDEAWQLEMVDLPPQELFARYKAGQVFITPRDEMQMDRFFQVAVLFSMRELALRYVAHRSSNFIRAYADRSDRIAAEPDSSSLLVCVSSSPHSGRLIRAGRRMADESRSGWTVVYVETPDQLDRSLEGGDHQSEVNVRKHLRLAEMLGARTEILAGRSVAEAVREYARMHQIRRILIGRSGRGFWHTLMGSSLAEQLVRDDPSINVYVVDSDYRPRPFRVPRFWSWMSHLQLLGSLILVMVPTLLGFALTPTVISRSANLVMIYLLAVVIASIFLGLVPALVTAVLSVLVFDFFFVPPIFRLFGFAPENAITFISLLIVGLIISTLVSRERTLTRAAQRRAGQVTQLYELSRDLAAAVDLPEIYETILQHVKSAFDREMVILMPHNDALELSASSAGKSLDSSELTAAEWAFQQGRPAGHGTGTFSYASFRYFPLETSRGIIGVMGVRMAGAPEMHPEQTRMLSAYVTKAASTIDRALFAVEASQAEILRATDKLQTALLNSISHDLRTPLASITGVLDSLRLEDDILDPHTRRELVETAYEEAERLNRLVGNLLDMSRLESGTLKISLQPCDIQDLVGSALNALGPRLEGHALNVDISPDLPLIPLDFVLINQVFINLLDNAAKYSPEGGPIDIRAWVEKGKPGSQGYQVHIEIGDRGPGIPEEDLGHIFEKFYRVKRFENVVGTGLGLSICKGIVEVHGGKIWAENRPDGGARVIFTLPSGMPVQYFEDDENAVKELDREAQP